MAEMVRSGQILDIFYDEQIGLINGLDLGYERKKGVKDNFAYLDLSHRKEFPFAELEKELLRGSIGHPMGYVK